MVISYTLRSPDITLAVTGNIAAGIREFLSLTVDQARAATIGLPRNEVTELNLTHSDDKMRSSTPTKKTLLLSWSVKAEYCPVPKQQDHLFGKPEINPALTLTWQLLVDLILEDDKALREEIMEIISKHMGS